ALASHILLEWIGEPYETQEVVHSQLRSTWYLEINPGGVVPALQTDDGWILTENVAILNYLADIFPAQRLGGDGTPLGRAEVNRWLGLINSDVHQSFKPLVRPERYLDDTLRYEELHKHSRLRLRSLFEQLNNQLADREWLAGHRSFADPYLFVTLRWARIKEVDLSGLVHLPLFVQRMRADPGVMAATQQEGLID
ncbi:glutathione S-transferase N-terminal domain-containing protein, partial [Pseudomonas sp. TH31]|uniref:glutathione S-transferase N-terminal domain-containing protein n=1 Tax=Pseudomonas sp. TH31 TaxID=2796396 RepID=UPI001914203F